MPIPYAGRPTRPHQGSSDVTPTSNDRHTKVFRFLLMKRNLVHDVKDEERRDERALGRDRRAKIVHKESHDCNKNPTSIRYFILCVLFVGDNVVVSTDPSRF